MRRSCNKSISVRKAATSASLFLLLGVVLTPCTADARVVGTDAFNYANGAIAGQTGGTGFAFEQTNDAGAPASSAADWDGTASVTGGALVLSGGATAFREYNGPSEGSSFPSNEREGAFRGFGTTYYKFTFSSSTPGTGYAGLSSFDFGTEKSFFGQTGGASFFGVSESGVGDTLSTVPIVANQTYTVIAEHDFDRDELKLWVNPAFTGEASHAATRTYTSGNWNSRFRIAADGGTTATFDNLVVATTYVQAINPDLNLVFADDLNKANGTTIPGSAPDVAAGNWRQPAGGSLTITDGAFDTTGAARVLFGDFTQALGPTKTLLLDFETINTAGTFHSGGYAGISLFVGSDANEKLFIGDLNGASTTWGMTINGVSSTTAVSGEPMYGQFSYAYDSGDYKLWLNGTLVLSGVTAANLAFDRIRIANGDTGDIAVSNLLVALVPEPATLLMTGVGLSVVCLIGSRRRRRV